MIVIDQDYEIYLIITSRQKQAIEHLMRALPFAEDVDDWENEDGCHTIVLWNTVQERQAIRGWINHFYPPGRPYSMEIEEGPEWRHLQFLNER